MCAPHTYRSRRRRTHGRSARRGRVSRRVRRRRARGHHRRRRQHHRAQKCRSKDDDAMRSIIVLKSYPLSRVGAATRASIDRSMHRSPHRWMWALNGTPHRWGDRMKRSMGWDGMGWDRWRCVGGIRGWGCDWSMGVSIGESGENL